MTRRPPPGVERLWHEALDDDPVGALKAIHELRARLRLWEHLVFEEAYRSGRSWRELAEAVGSSPEQSPSAHFRS